MRMGEEELEGVVGEGRRLASFAGEVSVVEGAKGGSCLVVCLGIYSVCF